MPSDIRSRPPISEAQLDEALEETFPASDPPSALLREEADASGPADPA